MTPTLWFLAGAGSFAVVGVVGSFFATRHFRKMGEALPTLHDPYDALAMAHSRFTSIISLEDHDSGAERARLIARKGIKDVRKALFPEADG
ncbi:hypothetical protein [Salipiger sp.]|uniref:hypothetical protein n=1 Tax=Salipiger sp. TaxID=2078585 RepID=UPI003A97F70F